MDFKVDMTKCAPKKWNPLYIDWMVGWMDGLLSCPAATIAAYTSAAVFKWPRFSLGDPLKNTRH